MNCTLFWRFMSIHTEDQFGSWFSLGAAKHEITKFVAVVWRNSLRTIIEHFLVQFITTPSYCAFLKAENNKISVLSQSIQWQTQTTYTQWKSSFSLQTWHATAKSDVCHFVWMWNVKQQWNLILEIASIYVFITFKVWNLRWKLWSIPVFIYGDFLCSLQRPNNINPCPTLEIHQRMGTSKRISSHDHSNDVHAQNESWTSLVAPAQNFRRSQNSQWRSASAIAREVLGCLSQVFVPRT